MQAINVEELDLNSSIKNNMVFLTIMLDTKFIFYFAKYEIKTRLKLISRNLMEFRKIILQNFAKFRKTKLRNFAARKFCEIFIGKIFGFVLYPRLQCTL
jgi:hypothetical protein